jgi:hypothetical protein
MKKKVIRSFGDYVFPVLLASTTKLTPEFHFAFLIIKINKCNKAIRSQLKGWKGTQASITFSMFDPRDTIS